MRALELLERCFQLLTSIGVAVSSLFSDSNESSESSKALVGRLVLSWIGLKPKGKRVLNHKSNSVMIARLVAFVHDDVVSRNELSKSFWLRQTIRLGLPCLPAASCLHSLRSSANDAVGVLWKVSENVVLASSRSTSPFEPLTPPASLDCSSIFCMRLWRIRNLMWSR